MHVISVRPVWQSLCERSSILEGNIEQAKQLVEWVEDENFCWELCYRASRDGWGARNFHRKCDDVGPTLILVKCETNVFGGFTDKPWKLSLPFAYMGMDTLTQFFASPKSCNACSEE